MNLPTTPSFRLDGKRALVAGASSGIGAACAAALAAQGAHVVCAARRTDALEALAQQLQAEGYSASALALDVAEPHAMQSVLAQEPRFDVVVNSAGLARHSPALQTEVNDFDAVVAVNLRGAYFLSTFTAQRMIEENRPGSIIHISSQMGHVGGIERALYCASKHGVEGMVKAMAVEWGPQGVRINSVCPTFVRTALTASTFDNPERVRWIEEKIKLGRVGEVEDIMGSVVYLASDASSLVTGTALMVDGGWTAD